MMLKLIMIVSRGGVDISIRVVVRSSCTKTCNFSPELVGGVFSRLDGCDFLHLLDLGKRLV